MNITLVPLMGLPSSGKSTLCSDILKYHNQLSLPTRTITFSYDDFVPISVQAKYSDIHAQIDAEEKLGDKLSEAKSFRRKFLRTIEFVVSNLLTEASFDNLKNSSIAEELDNLLNLEFNINITETMNSNYTSTNSDQQEQELISFGTTLYELVTGINFQDCKNIILLIDDNNYYHSMRNEIYQIAKKFKTGFCILYPQASVEECIKRNSEREELSRVPDSVIVSMSKKLEEPDPLQDTSDMYVLQISNIKEEGIHELIKSYLDASLQNPIVIEVEDRTEEIERERRICAENEIHQADKILRKWIRTSTMTYKLNEPRTSQNMKSFSEKLLEKKDSIMSGLRNGDLKVTASLSDYSKFQQEILEFAKN